ncbi:MAG: hypothetical protein IT210_20295 [Armatimonadetes bacterium]|nr:hypothetical protein [Armatimonadota bacterium]
MGFHRKTLLALAGALFSGILLLAGCSSRESAPVRAGVRKTAAPDDNWMEIKRVGDRSAKVVVEFYGPLDTEWHQKTINLIDQVIAQNKGRVRMELLPMGNEKADTQIGKRGYHCATILINGKRDFKIKERGVSLTQKPNDPASSYKSEDVPVIIRQEIEKQYGSVS